MSGILFLAIVVLVALWLYDGTTPVGLASGLVFGWDDIVTRGGRVSSSTPGILAIRAGEPVNETPEEIREQVCRAMGREISMNACHLARVGRSERAWKGSNLEAAIIMWTAWNTYLRDGSWTHITGSDGRYGRQRGDAWFATSADAYESDVLLGEEVERGLISDPTGGATNFMHPGGFADKAEWEAKRDAWIEKGLTMQTYPGAPGIVVFS